MELLFIIIAACIASAAFILQESEGEEAADSRITLRQNLGRGNIAERQSRVKLQEVLLELYVCAADTD